MIIQHSAHSIQIDRDKCTGCVVCTLACPAGAIRVKDNVAQIFREDLCIDCGECSRVCPEHAVQSMTSKSKDLTGFKHLVAIPSPVLYAQFDDSVTPNDVLLGLLKIGFNFVYDTALSCERVLTAMDIFLDESKEIRPYISNYCPAVVRLILKNYPELVNNIIPISVPREIAGNRVRAEVMRRTGAKSEEIGVFHITPCAAKMVSISNPVGIKKSPLNGAIAIKDIFGTLLDAVHDLTEDWILQRSSGVGLSWSINDGGGWGMKSKQCLSVTGAQEVIRVLDDVAAGRLKEVDYLECATCPEGCVGGPLVVKNKLFASRRIKDLIEQYGVRSRVDRKRVLRDYEEHFLHSEVKFVAESPAALDTDFRKALKKMNQIESYTGLLPGKNCAACGAPTCRTLAEDVVSGNAELSDCVFIKIKELSDAIEKNR